LQEISGSQGKGPFSLQKGTGPDAAMLFPEITPLVEGGRKISVDPFGKYGGIRELLEISREYFKRNRIDDAGSGPFYVRKSDAELTD
jgi:hypothetical protein